MAKAIISGVTIGATTYVPGQETALEAVITQAQVTYLLAAGVITGDWTPGATATTVSKVVAPTTNGAYAAGDVVGGIISIPAVNSLTGRRVTLKSLQINDKGNNSALLNIYFFKATPAAGTYTNNAALVWGGGDSANKVGQVSVLAADWLSDGSQCSVNFSAMGMDMQVAATTLFMIIVAVGAPTFAAGDLTMNMEFSQE